MKNCKRSILENISILVGTVTILIITPLTGHAEVSFLCVASCDASRDDAIVWTRAKDEAHPQPTAVNVQISTDSTFKEKVTTLFAGTADAPTDFTVKANLARLSPGTTYYYRFQTLNGA